MAFLKVSSKPPIVHVDYRVLHRGELYKNRVSMFFFGFYSVGLDHEDGKYEGKY